MATTKKVFPLIKFIDLNHSRALVFKIRQNNIQLFIISLINISVIFETLWYYVNIKTDAKYLFYNLHLNTRLKFELARQNV